MDHTGMETAEAFAAALEEAVGAPGAEGLGAVLLHGSVARGEAVAGLSDVNVLVLLDDVSPARLAEMAPLVRRWRQEEAVVPLLFTPAEWSRSTDVYPIEVADMLDAHRTLAGHDPLTHRPQGLAVSLRHMRLQTERELRGKLIHLREGVVLTADRPDERGRLLLAAAPSLATYLRTVLRLQRRDVPPATCDAARAAARVVGGDASAFLEVWAARSDHAAYRAELDTIAGVMALMEAAAHHVDTLEDR